MACKLCLTGHPTVKSHLTPRWVVHTLRDGEPSAFITTSNTRKSQPTQAGEFDRELLCAKCESRISNFERYAKSFILDRDWSSEQLHSVFPDDWTPLDERQPHKLYQVDNIDRKLLTLFVMSIVWKYSATSRTDHISFSIGPHETRFGKVLLGEAPFQPDIHSLILFKIESPVIDPDLSPKLLAISPRRLKFDGLNFTHLNICGFSCFLKTDSRPLTPLIAPFSIARSPVRIFMRDFFESLEWRSIREVI